MTTSANGTIGRFLKLLPLAISYAREIDILNVRRALHAAACAARKLPCCGWGALHDFRNLVEGDAEEIVQHEREALGGIQGVEDHEQRETNRVGHERFLLRINLAVTARDRL